MSVEINDIQFSDIAPGTGRALRVVEGPGISVSVSEDPNNRSIKILTINNTGGGGGTGNGYFPQGW